MRNIFSIGETVLDIIFKNFTPVAANPGGALLNTSVTLGRLGLAINYISEIGDDITGQHIINFLNNNNINTSLISIYSNCNSSLALAYLDETNNATYSFYKYYPEKRLSNIEDIQFQSNDIIIFGSSFSTNIYVRKQLLKLLQKAKKSNALIIYDPNYRKQNANDTISKLKMIEENISYCDIIRGSDEDFMSIFSKNKAEEIFNMLPQSKYKTLVYTKGGDFVDVVSSEFKKRYSIKKIKPISTIGAGDNFNAGLIFSFYKMGIEKYQMISENEWDKIIPFASLIALEVCLSLDNYISKEKAKTIKEGFIL